MNYSDATYYDQFECDEESLSQERRSHPSCPGPSRQDSQSSSGDVGNAPFHEQSQVMYMPMYLPCESRCSSHGSTAMHGLSSRSTNQTQVEQIRVLQRRDAGARDLNFQQGEASGSLEISGRQTKLLITSDHAPPPSTHPGQENTAFHSEVHARGRADTNEHQKTQDHIIGRHSAMQKANPAPPPVLTTLSPPTAMACGEQQVNADSAASISLSSAVGNVVCETGSRSPVQSKRGKKRKSSFCTAELDNKIPEKRAVTKSTSSRFLWSSDLHAQFCSSVFQVGLKQASPAAILNKMIDNDPAQFSVGGFVNMEQASLYLDQYRKIQGDVFTVRRQEWRDHSNDPQAPNLENSIKPGLKDIPEKDKQYLGELEYESLPSPYLRHEDLASPVGRAMGYLMGMVHCVSSQLLKRRIFQNKKSGVKNGNAGSQENQSSPIQHRPLLLVPRRDENMVQQNAAMGRLTHSALIAGTELHTTLEQNTEQMQIHGRQ